MGKRIDIQDDTELEAAEAEDLPEVKNEKDSQPQTGDAQAPKEDELANQLSAAKQEAQEHYDRLLRVSADYENYKKRTSREMKDLVKYANERLIKEVLTIVENLERAIASAPDDDPLAQGVNLTLNETLKILDRHHVAPIKSLGEPFDPNFHQAMMQEEVDDQPPNTVVKELQKGYMIHDRLLRPALVAVSKAKNNADPN